MKYVLKILTLTFFIASCSQNDNKQKELDLKEKELTIKQRELDLKEKELKSDSASIQQIEPAKSGDNSTVGKLGTYTVMADKAYFFNSPDPTTVRKGYMVKGDEINIQKVHDNYGYGVYTTSLGKQISGWVLLLDFQRSSNAANNKSNADYRKYIGTWKTTSGNEKESYNISYKNGEFSISVDWSKEFRKEMEADNHYNILSNCAFYGGKLKNGILKAKHGEGSSCDDEPEIVLRGDNQIVVSNQFEKEKVVYTRQQ